ncbi:tetratricopeptide repeat protein [Microcoleus sp. herbarium2]|uniref:tetratricopeptide repeat protein n=1 Tax=Microcoleus sp. herbarium2 TaxID=3055433 RepID=UPI002FD0142E
MNTNETAAIYLINGNQLLEEGNLEEAVAAFGSAIDLNPDYSWSHHNLGEALAKLGQLEEASAAFRRAIELNPDFSWSYHHLGDVLERQQQWKGAIAAFRQAIELNPEHFGSYVGLGKSLEKLGQLDEAIAAYRRASELAPDVDWIHYRLGEVLQQRTQVDLEGAIASYSHAIELNPDDVQAYRKLLQIQPDNWEVWLQLGNVLVKQEQWEEAIGCFRQSCELEPNSFSSHYQLGIALSQLTEIKIHSLKSNPETVKVLLSNLQEANHSASLSELNDIAFCRATDHLKDADFSREIYRAYLRREAEPEAITESGCQQFRQGGFTRLTSLKMTRQSREFQTNIISHFSVREIEQYIAIHWRSIEISYKNLAEEIACYQQALELDPTSSECQYYLSKALRKNGQLSESESFLKKAAYQGIILAEENRIEEALNIYNKGLEIIQGNRTYLLDLSLILVKKGHIKSLLNCYNKTVKLSSDIIRSSHELGVFLAEQGLLNDALICFQNTYQIPSDTKWGIYEKIWDDLNQINPSTSINCNCPTEINREDVAECFTNTSRYKLMTVEDISEPDKKYLEKVGFSLTQIELMRQDKFALEKIYINSFSDAPRELLTERLNLAKSSYQQSLVETGYVYTICPWSGKVLRSNQSFVINHLENPEKQRGHDLQAFCYRFVSKEVFYLIVGFPLVERIFAYFPQCELIINFFPNQVGFSQPVASINQLKSYMVGAWPKVINYISTPDKQVVDVIGLGFNIGHYLWQDLAGIHVLIEHKIQHKLDKILTGPGDYFSSREVFPEIPADKFLEVNDVHDVFEKVIENNYVALRVNGIFIKEQLTERVRQVSCQKCSQEFIQKVKEAKKQCFPLLGIQIRAKNSRRVWLSQVEGIANIINHLYADYPKLGIVFDGWSITGKEDESSSCWSMIDAEKATMNDIVALIPSQIPVYSAIGATTFETVVWWTQAIELGITSLGAGMTFSSWIANHPKIVVHASTFIMNSYGNHLSHATFRENLKAQVLVPNENITDGINNNYDCDWRFIYNEIVKFLNKMEIH